MSANESGDNVAKCYDAYEDVKRTNFSVHLIDASQQGGFESAGQLSTFCVVLSGHSSLQRHVS